jgi:hypothetical protein
MCRVTFRPAWAPERRGAGAPGRRLDMFELLVGLFVVFNKTVLKKLSGLFRLP